MWKYIVPILVVSYCEVLKRPPKLPSAWYAAEWIRVWLFRFFVVLLRTGSWVPSFRHRRTWFSTPLPCWSLLRKPLLGSARGFKQTRNPPSTWFSACFWRRQLRRTYKFISTPETEYYLSSISLGPRSGLELGLGLGLELGLARGWMLRFWVGSGLMLRPGQELMLKLTLLPELGLGLKLRLELNLN